MVNQSGFLPVCFWYCSAYPWSSTWTSIPPGGSEFGFRPVSAFLRSPDKDSRIPSRFEMPPLGHQLEVGHGVLGAGDSHRSPGAVGDPILPRPGIRVAIDIRKVVGAERPPTWPVAVDKSSGSCTGSSAAPRGPASMMLRPSPSTATVQGVRIICSSSRSRMHGRWSREVIPWPVIHRRGWSIESGPWEHGNAVAENRTIRFGTNIDQALDNGHHDRSYCFSPQTR